jgi:hemerythrin superfamily protein
MGTAKSRSKTDVIDILTAQHDVVDQLIGKLENGKLDAAGKLATFRELADKLGAHAAMEEKLFYPAVLATQTADELLEAMEEHLSIKRALADMLQGDIESHRFDVQLSVLKEEVTHHAREEEEGNLFPKVRKLFSADEREALGAECLALFEKLVTTEPRNQVRSQTRAPAKLRQRGIN